MDRLSLINERRRERRINRPTYMEWNIPRQVVVDTDDQGQLELYCEFCGALYWAKEVNSAGCYSKCCQRNKIVIPILDRIHPNLEMLINRINPNRQYNSLFGMAAVKSNFDPEDLDNQNNDLRRFNERHNNRIPYFYKVHGSVYYRILPMFNGPNGNLNLRAAQYLMLDTDRAVIDHMVQNWDQF